MPKTNSLVSEKEIVLPAIQPSAGARVAYQKKLESMIDEMHNSIVYHLVAAYRDRESEIVSDASPAVFFQEIFKAMSRRWLKKFSEMAPKIGEKFVNESFRRIDNSMKDHLKKIGFSVPSKMTRSMHNTLQGVIAEQVGLIKSIPEKHLREVEGLVMRTMSSGRDLKELSDELQGRYKITKKRAVLIARDQNNKANAVLQRQKRIDLGITEAIWMHSHGGRKPRPSHVAANGMRFDVRKGAYIDGEYILPGQLINCRCSSKSVIPRG